MTLVRKYFGKKMRDFLSSIKKNYKINFDRSVSLTKLSKFLLYILYL